MTRTTILALALLWPAFTLAQHAPSPYAGLEARGLKALSPQQVEELRQGSGMGLSLAAELNHTPGPRHVLELADPLSLTAPQRAAAQALFERMRTEAQALLTPEQVAGYERLRGYHLSGHGGDTPAPAAGSAHAHHPSS